MKKKNNIFKKLIPAAGMLLLSTAMLATSTYAWFSMNKTVTATGMQVTATSNSTYLLIGSDDDGNDTLAEIQATTNKTTACTIAPAAALVYPSDYVGAPDYPTNLLTGATNVTNTTTASAPSNWYYRVADLPTASTSNTPATALTSFSNYVLHKTVYVTLAEGSEDATNLVVSGSTFTSNSTASGDDATIAPVRVLVTSATAAVELTSTTTSSATVLAASVTDQAVVPLDIWIFYDGNDSEVYTNNIANLDGSTIDLQFSVTFNSDLG